MYLIQTNKALIPAIVALPLAFAFMVAWGGEAIAGLYGTIDLS